MIAKPLEGFPPIIHAESPTAAGRSPVPRVVELPAPASMVGVEHLRVAFESPYNPFCDEARADYEAFRRNRLCVARVRRHHGPSRGIILGLHYWCGGRLPIVERIFGASALYEAGFDVAFMTLPFHGCRTPEEAVFSGQYFPSRELRRSNEAFAQAVADARVLLRWLQAQGEPAPVGLVGISLGGYISALLASLGDQFDFVVPITAPASFADVLWWHGDDHPVRREAVEAGVTLERFRDIWAIHSPLSHDLRVPTDNALILAAAGDSIVRPAQPLAMWHHWDHPELRWFTGSHLAHVGRLDYMNTLLDWLDARF